MRAPEETTIETVRADLAALSDEAIVAVAGVVFIGLVELGFMQRQPLKVEALLADSMVKLARIFAGAPLAEEGAK